MRLLFGVTSHSSDQSASCAALLKRSYSGPGSTRTSGDAAPDERRARRAGSSTRTNLHHAGDFTPNAGASGLKARGRMAGAAAAPAGTPAVTPAGTPAATPIGSLSPSRSARPPRPPKHAPRSVLREPSTGNTSMPPATHT